MATTEYQQMEQGLLNQLPFPPGVLGIGVIILGLILNFMGNEQIGWFLIVVGMAIVLLTDPRFDLL